MEPEARSIKADMARMDEAHGWMAVIILTDVAVLTAARQVGADARQLEGPRGGAQALTVPPRKRAAQIDIPVRFPFSLSVWFKFFNAYGDG